MSITIVAIVSVCLVMTALNLIMTAVLFRQLGVFVLGSARGANDSGISVGRRLPKLDLIDVRTGSTVDMHDARPKLLFFGSTTCSECSRVYPDVKFVEDRYGIPVVNILFGRDLGEVSGYAESLGLKGPVVLATEDIARAYDVEVNPFAFVVDRRGLVAAKGLMNSRVQLINMLAPIQQIDFSEENENEIHVNA